KDVPDFYRVFSLVYPVHFSSLHSSPYLFDKFISDYDPQEPYQWKLSRFKPIHLLFIDEAAMALPHLAFPAIYWAEKTIAVGDPVQISPVITVDDHTLEIYHSTYFNTLDRSRFSPGLTTVYHRAARCETGTPHDIGQACFLDEHRRCQSPIAKLFKEIGSYKLLQVNTPPLDIESDDFRRIQEFGGKHLVFYDVHGIPGHEERTNQAEALTIKEILKKLKDIGYYIPSIHKSDRKVSNNEENGINGACDQREDNTAIEESPESSMKSDVIIITPYRKQEEFLKTQLKDLISPQYIGTIHKFQGTEAKVVIFSSVIYKDTDPTSFINSSSNILNVAVSRAKHLFIMVGNLKKIKASGGYLNTIAEFCSTHGLVIEGVEFDETPERQYKYNKKMKELKDKSAVKVINTVQDHMTVFKDILESAQQEIIIVCPWIRKHNLDNFSFDLIKSASERNCEISIIYGYSNNDFGDLDAIKKLQQLKNVKLIKHPATTHSKLIIVDSKIAVVGSFNWLSHSYWKTNINLGFYPRQEISLLTDSSEIIEELLCQLPIGRERVNVATKT
ncbi:AAA domain-containing protein, partial [Thermodesulfovibrio yellowstonii]|uniref:AAA domain-containing protein n=1 Tax=Thermodesulfovibrio yellowstonii TaxID=28262 RepID=UPI003C7A8B0D